MVLAGLACACASRPARPAERSVAVAHPSASALAVLIVRVAEQAVDVVPLEHAKAAELVALPQSNSVLLAATSESERGALLERIEQLDVDAARPR